MMKINNQDINIDDLISEKYMHKMINNYVFLSDYQIEVLKQYKIDPYMYNNINDLMFQIDEVLEEDEIEDLEIISREISEFNYYTNTDK